MYIYIQCIHVHVHLHTVYTCTCTCISVCPYSIGYRVYLLQVKRKKSPVSDDGDDENGVKDEDED